MSNQTKRINYLIQNGFTFNASANRYEKTIITDNIYRGIIYSRLLDNKYLSNVLLFLPNENVIFSSLTLDAISRIMGNIQDELDEIEINL